LSFLRAIRSVTLVFLATLISCSAYPPVDEWGLYYYQYDRLIKLITLDFSQLPGTPIGLASWIRNRYPMTIPEKTPLFVLYAKGADSREIPKTVEDMVRHIRLIELPPIGERTSYEGEVGMGITPVEDLQHKIFPYLLGRFLPKDKFLFHVSGELKHDHYYAIYFDAPYTAGWNFRVKLMTPQLPGEYYADIPDSAAVEDSSSSP